MSAFAHTAARWIAAETDDLHKGHLLPAVLLVVAGFVVGTWV
jgi:hypothetical protein